MLFRSNFTPKNGRNDVLVRQTDVAGNISDTTALSFVYKTSAKGLGLGLTRDTGKSNIDKITSDAGLSLTGVEDGASVEYSTDGGTTWSANFTPKNGRNDVLVRQTDVAGNISDTTALSFVYKTSAKGLGLGLTRDTGKSNIDKIKIGRAHV